MKDPVEQTTDQDHELTRAKNTAYRCLSIRPRSKSEIEAKLRDKQFSHEVISRVIAGLSRLGYVNDERFAEIWASSRMRLRGFGRRRIEQELRQKGVSRDAIHHAMQTVYGEQPEDELAWREANKKLKTLARFGPEVRRRRLAGHLERKGYSSGTVSAVLRTLRVNEGKIEHDAEQ